MTLANATDIALIFLIIHASITCLVPLVIFYFAARGMVALNQRTRRTMPLVQNASRRLAETSGQVSQQIAEPFLATKGTWARYQSMMRRAKEGPRFHNDDA